MTGEIKKPIILREFKELESKIDKTKLLSINAEGAKISEGERYEKNCEIISDAFGIILDNDAFVKQAIEKKAFVDSKTTGIAKEKVERAIDNIAKVVESEFKKRDLHSLDLDETKLLVEMAEIIADIISTVRDATKTFKNLVMNRCGEVIEAKKAEIEAAKTKILPTEVLKKPDDAKKEIGEKEAGEEEKEKEKRAAISKFLWKKIESAIKEKFGAEAYFKRFITDEIIDRFVKELSGLFCVNEEGFVKSKNSSKKGINEFRMKSEKFAQDYLKNIDESIKARKIKKAEVEIKDEKLKLREKSKFKTKIEFITEFGLGNLNKKHEDREGSSFYYSEYSAETGLVTIRVWNAGVDYSGEKKQDKMKIDLEKFREIMEEMKKPDGMAGKKTLKEMLGFRKEKVEKTATTPFGIAPEKPEQENEIEKEFTEEEKEILEIYLEDAKEMVSFVNNLDYEGEYGYPKERISVLREIELERFWDKFEQGILKEGEFAGEKLRKAMEYWKKMSLEK